MKCSECRWFKRDSESESVYGLCKRYPPTIIEEEWAQSPYVYENDFCGEFITPEAQAHMIKAMESFKTNSIKIAEEFDRKEQLK